MKNFKKHIKPVAVLVPLACILTAALPMPAMASSVLVEDVDNTMIFDTMVNLNVYIDGELSGQFSDTYVFDTDIDIVAPETSSGKKFSYWEAEGTIISYNPNIKLCLTANTTLNAVYGKKVVPAEQTVGFSSVNKDDSNNILFNLFTTDTNANIEAGIYYSTSASTQNMLISSGTKRTAMQDSEQCWTLTVIPEAGKDYYYAIPYIADGANTYYGSVKKVSLSSLDFSSFSILDFDTGIDNDSTIDLSDIPTAQIQKSPTGRNMIYNGSEQILITAGIAEGGTMQYSFDEYSGYSTKLPTASEIGTYTIWYKAAGDDSHLNSPPASVTSTITENDNKLEQDFTVSLPSYAYDGTAYKPVITGETYGKVIVTYYDDDTNKLLSYIPSDVGNYRVRVYACGDTDHYSKGITVKYTIFEPYSVTVKNGTINGKPFGTFAPDTVIVVKSDKAPDGYKFGYWKRNGVTTSYNPTYTFAVTSDNIELEAVYLEDTDNVERYGYSVKDSVSIDKANKKISFVYMNNVPEDCTIVKCGIVATSDASQAETLALGNAEYEKEKTTNKHNYKYTWIKSNITENQTWYVKGYLVYKDADGSQKTVYSDLEKTTLNGSETIKEEKILGATTITSVKPYTNEDTSKGECLDFVSLSSVPADCTIQKAGLVATSDASKAQNLTAENADYVRTMTTTKHNVQYTWTKTKVTASQTWYVKAYLVYTDANGKTQTVYSDLTTGKLN